MLNYNFISNVVPDVRQQLDLPFALATHHPLQVGIADCLLAADPAILHLREVAFEEVDLVFICRAGDIGGSPLHGEVIVNSALINGCFGLGNKLCAPHVAIPFCGAVDGDLCALLGASITRVLVVGRKVDVICYGAGAMDVVLIVADLV